MKMIPLTKGMVSVIDDADFAEASKFLWHAKFCNGFFYAARHGKDTTIYLHRWIMGEPEIEVDHIDGVKLNNQRSNLRLATRGQNMFNVKSSRKSKSGFIGVRKTSKLGWQAYVSFGNKQETVGVFPSAEDAARARDKWVVEHREGFGILNFTIPKAFDSIEIIESEYADHLQPNPSPSDHPKA